jgi:hypothetical protein
VAVGEETTWVGNNLADMEASSVVSTCSAIDAHKEGTGQAAVGDPAVVGSLRVGECKTRRSGLALDALVDVCRCHGRGHVLTSYTGEGDVLLYLAYCSWIDREEITHVADGVLSGIDSVLENALCAGLARAGSACIRNDLVGCGLDVVLGGVVEEFLVLLPSPDRSPSGTSPCCGRRACDRPCRQWEQLRRRRRLGWR